MRTRTNRSDRPEARSSFKLSNWLLKSLNGSKIGFAIYDKGFHYVGVNSAIAKMNGVSPEEHLGQTAPEVIGRTAKIIEARIDRVFLTGQPVYQHEFSAKLPMRTDIGYWIQDYFPIGDERDRVSHVGIFVIEVTQQRRVEGILRHLRTSMITSVGTIDGREELLALINAAQPQGTHVWRELPLEANFDSPSGIEFPADVLSVRELQVLSLLAQGKSSKEVASALAISQKTVATYKSRVKRKLGLKSLVELVHYAIRQAIVKP
jgi:DNA-binding CsgD family transcriptional regulator